MAKLYFRYATMKSGKSSEIIQINYNYNAVGFKGLILIPDEDETSDGFISSRIGLSIPALKITKEDNLFELVKDYIKTEKISYVILDEANFITYKQANQLGDIVDFLDIDVLAYGLLTDFTSDIFGLREFKDEVEIDVKVDIYDNVEVKTEANTETDIETDVDDDEDEENKISGIARLIAIQDELEEISVKSICKCGKKANFNARIVNGKLVTKGKKVILDPKNGEENHITYVPLCRKCFKLKELEQKKQVS